MSEVEAQSLRTINELKNKHCDELREYQAITNARTREVKNLPSTIIGYLDISEPQKIREVIGDFLGGMPKNIYVETGNAAVNALMSKKSNI